MHAFEAKCPKVVTEGGPGEIAVCATKGDWREVIDSLWYDAHGLSEDSGGWKLIQALKAMGVK